MEEEKRDWMKMSLEEMRKQPWYGKKPYSFEVYNEKGEVVKITKHEGSNFTCKACEWNDEHLHLDELMNPDGKLDVVVCPSCGTKNYRKVGILVWFEEDFEKVREWVYELLDMGISFDRGFGMGAMDWNLDWSLGGATPDQVIEMTAARGLKFKYNYYGWYSLEPGEVYDTEPISEEDRRKSFTLSLALDALSDAMEEGSEKVAEEWEKLEKNWRGKEVRSNEEKD